jgi:hypothetical protein
MMQHVLQQIWDASRRWATLLYIHDVRKRLLRLSKLGSETYFIDLLVLDQRFAIIVCRAFRGPGLRFARFKVHTNNVGPAWLRTCGALLGN